MSRYAFSPALEVVKNWKNLGEWPGEGTWAAQVMEKCAFDPVFSEVFEKVSLGHTGEPGGLPIYMGENAKGAGWRSDNNGE